MCKTPAPPSTSELTEMQETIPQDSGVNLLLTIARDLHDPDRVRATIIIRRRRDTIESIRGAFTDVNGERRTRIVLVKELFILEIYLNA